MDFSMDFSNVSDAQLFELLKATMREAIHRGGAIAAAAQDEVISAQERAKIEFEVAEKIRIEAEEKERQRIKEEAEARLRAERNKKEAEKIESAWSVKAAAIQAIRKWGYQDEFEIAIWSRGSDRRVYFEKPGITIQHPEWRWCLYVTGNNWHPPGELEGTGAKCFFDDKQDELKAFLKAVAASWKGDIKIPCSAGDVEASPKRLEQYLVAIGIKKAQENANV